MKNKTIKIIGAFAGLAVIGFLILTLSLDGIVKSSIQQTGSDLLKTEVHVDNVSLSIFSGQGSIDGFIVQNPEGFSDRAAIRLQNISFQIDLSTLLSDTVVVNNLVIQKPELYMEQTTGGNNLRTLQNSLNASSSSDGSYESYLVVEHLLVNNGSVGLTSTIGEERSVQATFDQIELTGIGKDGNNTTRETIKEILEPVLEKAIREAAKEGVLDAVKDKLNDILGGD